MQTVTQANTIYIEKIHIILKTVSFIFINDHILRATGELSMLLLDFID